MTIFCSAILETTLHGALIIIQPPRIFDAELITGISVSNTSQDRLRGWTTVANRVANFCAASHLIHPTGIVEHFERELQR